MEKFKVGDIVEVIRTVFLDEYHGLHNGDIGKIKSTYDDGIYDVYFHRMDEILAMTGEQLKKYESPSSDNPQEIKFPSIGQSVLNPLYIRNNTLYGYVKVDSGGNCIDDFKIEKEKKYMRILDLYKFRKLEEINTAKENKLKEIKSFDSIHSLLDDTEEQLNALLGREENNKVTIEVKNLNGQPLYDDIAENKIRQVFDEYNKKLHDLDKVTEEASALLELTSDYEEQIKILKKYDILDKGGKLNV